MQTKHILFSFRLSNQRKSREVVDDFVNNYGTIEVNKQIIRARRLITPGERLGLSNVCSPMTQDFRAPELK